MANESKPSRTQIEDLEVSEAELTVEEARRVKGGTGINDAKLPPGKLNPTTLSPTTTPPSNARHQIRQETDNKVREMHNETYVK